MVIQHNVLAANAQRQYNIVGKRKASHAEKLSSGYRINRAADDAAGLAISEKMRKQIRGLTRGTVNAEEGISYVQTADGAMNEVHEMLQRMNELTIQSLNGTLSDSDRSYLDDEFSQLRTEIDRINTTTDFNDQRIFEDHENAYWSLTGNKRWDLSQLHKILPSPANEMTIHLPDGYEPKDYTLKVPAGTYTTRELIDEIDTALENLEPPNPGFVFDRTKEGYCRLTFEGGSGINAVDGPLAYLFFDSAQGTSTSDILGASEFPLKITSGHNDTLGFYVEGRQDPINIKIQPGTYSRSEMIKRINDQLPNDLKSLGVKAEEYEDTKIKISSGTNVNISGLWGNMFKWEDYQNEQVYDSAFYDNIGYGNSSATSASITGESLFSNGTSKIHLTAANNILRFKIDGAPDSDYKKIIFPEKQDGYTISEIVNEINKQLDYKGATARTSGNRLVIESQSKGSKSKLEFDLTDPVYEAAYNTLFCETKYFPELTGTGANWKASTTGAAAFKNGSQIELDPGTENSLSFNVTVDGGTVQSCQIDGIGGIYPSLDDLLQKLNDNITPPAMKDKIIFDKNNSGQITIKPKDGVYDIKRIDLVGSIQQTSAYKKLFTTSAPITVADFPANTDIVPVRGTVTKVQGSPPRVEKIATVSIKIADPNKVIEVDQFNTLRLSVLDSSQDVTVPKGNYAGINKLVEALNDAFKKSTNGRITRVEASYDGANLILSYKPEWDDKSNTDDEIDRLDNGNRVKVMVKNFDIGISTSNSNNSIWGAIVNNHPGVSSAGPSVQEKKVDPYKLTTKYAVTVPVTVDDKNNKLTLGGKTITLTNKTYATLDELKNELGTKLGPDITVTEDGGKLQFQAADGKAIYGSGSFYDDVLAIKQSVSPKPVPSPGSYDKFSKAFIVGSKDLTGDPVEIAKDVNDEFIFNFTHPGKTEPEEFKITIPPGSYTGSDIALCIQEEIQKKFDESTEENLHNLKVKASVAAPHPEGIQTGSAGNIDNKALQIKIECKDGKEPAVGQYILDGIRGSAAGFVFYKTTAAPTPTFLTGTKKLSAPIKFGPSNNVLTMKIDGKPYKCTFPTGKEYTADEFNNLLKDMFKDAPISASLENGYLKLAHKVVGKHSITDIGGNARSYLFLEEDGRSSNSQNPLRLQVSDESRDTMDIPRMRIGSKALGIHSVFISELKYAEKALRRVQAAIDKVGAKRGTYGAIQNRLEHLVANNNNIVENTTAAESRIRDADMAKEMVGFSISNILAQAGESMLSQANQSNQGVVALLG